MKTIVLSILSASVHGCTNLFVSKGASLDSATIAAYNADDDALFGSIDLRPAAVHPPGTMRAVWDWDSQEYTGEIPEVSSTFNVVGNINDQGVIITETTFGGLDDLSGTNTGAIMSYGDLIFVTLQRAATAREAINLFDSLTAAYGYESQGESFGICDSQECWLMELIGKGKHGKGAVWVASRVPDGWITATANQARTETFAQNDPDNVLFAKDVISFAREIGVYNGTDAAFNFREAYDPISFGGARFCEARVWNLFMELCDGCVADHLDFAQGRNLSNSMPLFVKPSRLLSLNDTMEAMRTHGEDFYFENDGVNRPDVGAESGHSPYRFRPLTWEFNGSTYLNERTVGVQQSGWAFIAMSRSHLPAPIRAVSYFAPDDSSTSPRIPVYGGITRIPASFGSLVGQTPGGGVPYAPVTDSWTMSLDSAFWVWNLVGNMAFSERYGSARSLVLQRVEEVQARLFAQAKSAETDFVALYPVDPVGAIEQITQFSESTGQALVEEWRNFWMFLFATFRDGGIFTAPTTPQCVDGNRVNCTAKLVPNVNEIGYSDDWKARIVEDSDNKVRYLVPTNGEIASMIHELHQVKNILSDVPSEDEIQQRENQKVYFASGKNKLKALRK
jgi:dipeptidase